MGSQLPELEKLFDEWQQKHEKLLSTEAPYFLKHEPPYGKFVRDGVINLENWKKQKFRICLVLPEASGYTDLEKYPNGVDITEIWNKRGAFSPLLQLAASWIQGILDSTLPPVTYSKEDLKKKRHELIRSIAVVNLKKSDGQLAPSYKGVQAFAQEDADEIRKEIDIIKANIIVCGSTYSLMHGPRPQGDEPPERRQFVFYNDELVSGAQRVYRWGKNKLVIDLWSPHQKRKPAASKSFNYYAVREICRAGLKSFKAPAEKK